MKRLSSIIPNFLSLECPFTTASYSTEKSFRLLRRWHHKRELEIVLLTRIRDKNSQYRLIFESLCFITRVVAFALLMFHGTAIAIATAYQITEYVRTTEDLIAELKFQQAQENPFVGPSMNAKRQIKSLGCRTRFLLFQHSSESGRFWLRLLFVYSPTSQLSIRDLQASILIS